ncbi:PAAR domain-containing protein [Sphingomonas sanguinis]|uniref:PAAR domain-containing protein n=1 Tax=Sphingomonas sanguinis TaxID=33051 RepID=UPI0007376A31|nr:PAAR domain-containing protein [Sphingomonas sanguinis]
MTVSPAARVGDNIAHSNAGTGMLLGVLAGAAVGAVLVAATVATGGLALVAAAGAAAGMVSAGGLGGMYIGEASMGPACGRFTDGSPNVFINGKAALFTAGSFASCDNDSGRIPLATGSSSVFINTGMAGREGEKVGCSAVSVAKVSPNVFIGGDSAQDPRVEIQPEVPAWAVTGLQILGVAGAIAALPFAFATVGVAATIGGAVLGGIGAYGGAKGGRALGEALGLSEAGKRALETAGGFLGGMVGGAAGVRGGQAAQFRYNAWRNNPFKGEPVLPKGASEKLNFEAKRPEGLDIRRLSPSDSAAQQRMQAGGWSKATQEQVLDSGRDFRIVPGKKGDNLYGFSSKNYAKKDDSPYWMDEPTYRDMQTRYRDPVTGKWDSPGIKNELALPCYNRADAVYRGQLTQDQDMVASTINPARETVTHVSSDGTKLTSFDRAMTGGGTQIAPTNGSVGDIQEYFGP